MPKIQSLVHAEAQLARKEKELEPLSLRIEKVASKIEKQEGKKRALEDERDLILQPLVAAVERADALQRCALGGWVFKGTRKELYHHRYAFSKGETQGAEWHQSRAWLRNRGCEEPVPPDHPWHKGKGIRPRTPLIWRVTLTLHLPLSQERKQVFVPGDTQEECLANADKILEDHGWILSG